MSLEMFQLEEIGIEPSDEFVCEDDVAKHLRMHLPKWMKEKGMPIGGILYLTMESIVWDTLAPHACKKLKNGILLYNVKCKGTVATAFPAFNIRKLQ